MNKKRVLGYIFIALFIVLAIAVIGMLSSLTKAIGGFFRIFTGTLNSEQAGAVTGSLIYWALHFTLMSIFWKYGRRWTKKG